MTQKKPDLLHQICVLSLFAIAATFVAVWFVEMGAKLAWTMFATFFAAVTLALLALVATVVMHELGHLIAAQMVGFKFRILTLGPWSIIATPNGLRHRFSLKVMGLIFGQQLSTPPDLTQDDDKFQVYLAGGGVANILTATLALLCWYGFELRGLSAVFIGAFAGWSLFLGIINLMPFRTKMGVASDGYNMQALRQNTLEARRFRALIALMGDAYAGARPRDWSPQIVATLNENASSPYETALGLLLAYQHALDRGEAALANTFIPLLVAVHPQIPAAMQSHFGVEIAHHYGLIEPDAELARQFADAVNAAKQDAYLLSPSAVHRALAAAALVEGKFAQGLEECELGLRLVNEGITELDRLMEHELLLAMKTRFMAALQ